MLILEKYLKSLTQNDLDTFLSKFPALTTYETPKDLELGLLRFKEPPSKKIAFLFIFPEEDIQIFHTVGMKFPIQISFFTAKKGLIYTDVYKPGIQEIDSKQKCKYVIENVFK